VLTSILKKPEAVQSMTTVGWSALGGLVTKVLAESSSLTETLCYTNVAIAVCGAVAALLVIADSRHKKEAYEGRDKNADNLVENCRTLAEQARFADSRARLLGLSERLSGNASHQKQLS
jgi:hypothetical protein